MIQPRTQKQCPLYPDRLTVLIGDRQPHSACACAEEVPRIYSGCDAKAYIATRTIRLYETVADTRHIPGTDDDVTRNCCGRHARAPIPAKAILRLAHKSAPWVATFRPSIPSFRTHRSSQRLQLLW